MKCQDCRGIALFTQHSPCYQPVLTFCPPMLEGTNFSITTVALAQILCVLDPRFLHLLPHLLVDLICAGEIRAWVHAQAGVWDLS